MGAIQSKPKDAGKKPRKTAKKTKKTVPAKAKRSSGRPQFVPTQEQRLRVSVYVGAGLTQAEIAKLIVNPGTGRPVDEKTLRKFFAPELGEPGSDSSWFEGAENAFVPTPAQRELVKSAAGVGVPNEMIAPLVTNSYTGRSITAKTLARAFPDELETGRAQGGANVLQTLYGVATNPLHPKCVEAAGKYMAFVLKMRTGENIAATEQRTFAAGIRVHDNGGSSDSPREFDVYLQLEETKQVDRATSYEEKGYIE
jgi:hypothetical protein